jgi:hypothetical protein
MARPEDMARLHSGERDLSDADLSWSDLRGLDLRGINLSKGNLTRSDLRGTKLQEANLHLAVLREADLASADLTGANLSGVDAYVAYFQFAILGQTDLREADLSRADFTGADLRFANLAKSNLHSCRLQAAKLDGAILTDAKLWEIQRAGWSIKGIICDRVYWDMDGSEVTHYYPGEFEQLYSEHYNIQLFYKGGITRFELNTLPALLSYLTHLRPDCNVRLRSMEEVGGGVRITITVEDGSTAILAEIEGLAKQLQQAQMALRDESRRAERLQIEKELLVNEVFPRVLTATGQQIHIGGSATGVLIAGGTASIKAHQKIYDRSTILELLKKIADAQHELN